MFRVIEGGRGGASAQRVSSDPKGAIVSEGRRRLDAAGLERFEARERLTGVPVPRDLRNFKLQIEFAVRALSSLTPIPADIETDKYWPSLQEGVTRAGVTPR